MFPQKLSDLDHLRDEKMIRFKDETVSVNGVEYTFTIVCYMIANTELWELPLAKECRGITYDHSGNCVGAPFEKFFNINENDDTQLDNLPKGDYIITSKRDGSLIIPIQVGTDIVFKSKKTFTSDVALLASKHADTNVVALSKYYIDLGYTPIFEFTHPDSRIVIDYGPQPEFVLLAVRSMSTGEYLAMSSIEPTAELFKVKSIEWDTSSRTKQSIKQYSDWLEHQENIEGSVIWFQTCGVGVSCYGGLRVKRKTVWYGKRHGLTTGLRERDIAEMVLNETVDDIKSFVVELGYPLDPILEIEHKVTTEISAIRGLIEMQVAANKHLDRKDFAVKFKDLPLFGLLMAQYLDKEPDIIRHYTKHILPMFTLRTVFSYFKKGDDDVE